MAFFSRVLTILWLFCGAIILSLFTANVTSVLTSNQMDSTKDLIGTRVSLNLVVGNVIMIVIMMIMISVSFRLQY